MFYFSVNQGFNLEMWPEDVSVEYFKRKIFSIPCKIPWLPEKKFLLTGKKVKNRMKKNGDKHIVLSSTKYYNQMLKPHYNLRP